MRIFTSKLTENVVLLLGFCIDPLSVVTEFLERGSLYNYLRSEQQIDVKTKTKMIVGIAKGMLHIHLENIVHRDLATRNVLLSATLDPKITDFVT